VVWTGAACHGGNVEAVHYRHEVPRDLDDDAVREPIEEFARTMHTMRERLALVRKLRYRYQKESWFLDAVDVYCGAVAALCDQLTRVVVTSRGLRGLRDYLAGYLGSDGFRSLLADTRRVRGELAKVTYCVRVRGARVKVSRYDEESDYSTEVEKTFAKFKQGAVKDHRVTFPDYPDMNHVEAQVLHCVARLYPETSQALDDYCVRHNDYLDDVIGTFDREVQFYLAYLSFARRFALAGLDFCYPQVSARCKEIRVEGAFDLALAIKLVPQNAEVVCNDFHLDGQERIFVVTGPNQGGKTTFARTVGQLSYLASLGCPVPARRARLFLPDQLFTHFEREESLATLRGKLDDELVRIRDILERATTNSVIVMNESFTSTTLNDALFIGTQVLNRVIELGSVAVYVTFVDELASLGEATVSMVGTVVPDDPARRTYKLERKPADGLAYAAAIATKYRLTYNALRGACGPMKVFLMHPDRDVDLEQELPPNEQALIQDLELERLLTTMAAGDKFLLDVARRVVLTSLTDRDLIGYRQRVLADCIERPAIIQRVYDIAVDAIGSERKVWFGILFRDSPESILRRSVQVMELLVGNLRQLRQVADDHAREFQSVGFTRLFAMLADELDDEYFATIEEHLRQLKFRHGVLMSAELGKGNKGVRYVLHRPGRSSWWNRMTGKDGPATAFRSQTGTMPASAP
jgi:DNA mismatch repair protein MutS